MLLRVPHDRCLHPRVCVEDMCVSKSTWCQLSMGVELLFGLEVKLPLHVLPEGSFTEM